MGDGALSPSSSATESGCSLLSVGLHICEGTSVKLEQGVIVAFETADRAPGTGAAPQ